MRWQRRSHRRSRAPAGAAQSHLTSLSPAKLLESSTASLLPAAPHPCCSEASFTGECVITSSFSLGTRNGRWADLGISSVALCPRFLFWASSFALSLGRSCSGTALEGLGLGADEGCSHGTGGVAAFPKGRTVFNSLNLLPRCAPQPYPLE